MNDTKPTPTKAEREKARKIVAKAWDESPHLKLEENLVGLISIALAEARAGRDEVNVSELTPGEGRNFFGEPNALSKISSETVPEEFRKTLSDFTQESIGFSSTSVGANILAHPAPVFSKSEKDFENSLTYWRDLAKMLREEVRKVQSILKIDDILPKLTIRDFLNAKDKYDPAANNYAFELYFDAVRTIREHVENRLKNASKTDQSQTLNEKQPVVLGPSDAEIQNEFDRLQKEYGDRFKSKWFDYTAQWFRSQVKAVVLPERKREETPLDCSNDAIYRLGFNACLDEIEGMNK